MVTIWADRQLRATSYSSAKQHSQPPTGYYSPTDSSTHSVGSHLAVLAQILSPDQLLWHGLSSLVRERVNIRDKISLLKD